MSLDNCFFSAGSEESGSAFERLMPLSSWICNWFFWLIDKQYSSNATYWFDFSKFPDLPRSISLIYCYIRLAKFQMACCREIGLVPSHWKPWTVCKLEVSIMAGGSMEFASLAKARELDCQDSNKDCCFVNAWAPCAAPWISGSAGVIVQLGFSLGSLHLRPACKWSSPTTHFCFNQSVLCVFAGSMKLKHNENKYIYVWKFEGVMIGQV